MMWKKQSESPNMSRAVSFVVLLGAAISVGAETYSVSSPDGANEIRLMTEPVLAYQVLRDGRALTEHSTMALEIKQNLERGNLRDK